jgi:hypothetical protein
MALIRFDDKAFRSHMAQWIEQVADNDLSRAWDIVVGCLAVHAKLDREARQSRAQALREAYLDFTLLYEGEDGTHTMMGMIGELEFCCPDSLVDDGTFDRVCREAMATARGEAVADAPETPHEPPSLQLLQGGKHE